MNRLASVRTFRARLGLLRHPQFRNLLVGRSVGTRTALLIALGAVTIPAALTVLEPGVRKTRASDARSEASEVPVQAG
jgi:hypothetical protein